MWSMSKLNRGSLCTLLVQGTDQWSTNCTYNEIFSSLNQLHKVTHCLGGRLRIYSCDLQIIIPILVTKLKLFIELHGVNN